MQQEAVAGVEGGSKVGGEELGGDGGGGQQVERRGLVLVQGARDVGRARKNVTNVWPGGQRPGRGKEQVSDQRHLNKNHECIAGGVCLRPQGMRVLMIEIKQKFNSSLFFAGTL